MPTQPRGDQAREAGRGSAVFGKDAGLEERLSASRIRPLPAHGPMQTLASSGKVCVERENLLVQGWGVAAAKQPDVP